MAKKILLIDDDAELCRELSDMLSGAGFLVETAGDGRRGAALASAGEYDVILLDCKLPLMDGVQVLKTIAARARRPGIIVITGNPHIENTMREANLFGMVNAFISKPFEPEVLMAEIERASAR